MIIDKKFTFTNLNLPTLNRYNVDNVRVYEVPKNGETKKMVSITSITSNYKKEFFDKWRKRVGLEEANRITKQSTNRGTDTHTLIENYLLGKELEDEQKILPISKLLFNIVKSDINRIDNIHCLESSLYSELLNVAGTVDTIAEFDGVLSVIDYKTSHSPKPREWIESYFVQAMFYAMAFYEMTGYKAKQLVIIMACEDGESVIYKETNFKKYAKLLLKYIKKFIVDNGG